MVGCGYYRHMFCLRINSVCFAWMRAILVETGKGASHDNQTWHTRTKEAAAA